MTAAIDRRAFMIFFLLVYLGAANAYNFHPGDNYFQSKVGGDFEAWMEGPNTDADFDLALFKFVDNQWQKVRFEVVCVGYVFEENETEETRKQTTRGREEYYFFLILTIILQVAASEGGTSQEQVSYTGTSGYYVWRVRSFEGTGNYNIAMVNAA